MSNLDFSAGDHVSTTYDHGRESIHAIVARKIDAHCESGVMYRVVPDLGGWIDAHWFTAVEGYEIPEPEPDYEPDEEDDEA